MIAWLEGEVAGRVPEGCVLQVGGMVLRLTCPATTLRTLPPDGERFRLFTYLHVREDILALYGFATAAEQRLFEALLAVSGVGPRVAVAIGSAFSPEAFERAVAAGDAGAIAGVPGIGRKTAQRIVLELKDKLLGDGLEEGAGALAEARSALENLGYSAGEVRLVLAEVAPSQEAAIEDVVRAALAKLGRPGG